MTRYIIIGSGAVGGALAATLHEAGRSTVLVARGASLAAIRAKGLVYTRPSGTTTHRLDVVGGPDEVTLTSEDVLVLTTKAQDAEAALAAWAWQPVAFEGRTGTASELTVLTLQNGLETERLALRRFTRVIAVTTLLAGIHVTPGEILTGAAPRVGQLFLGPVGGGGGRTDDLSELVADLTAAQWLVQEVADVTRWKAWKLLHNVTNAVELFSGDPTLLATVREEVVAETRAVLAAAGLEVADPASERVHDASLSVVVPGGGYVSGQQSTWQSFARGVSNEIDHLNGEVVLLGRLHGVATPYSSAVQAALGASGLAGEAPGTRDVSAVPALLDTTPQTAAAVRS